MSSKSCINLGKAPEIFEIAKKFNLNPVLAQAKITTWMKKNNTVEFPTVDLFAKYMGVDLTTVEKTDVSKEVEHFFKDNDNLKGWNELNKEYNAFEREEKAMIISDLFSSFLNESVKQYKTLTRKEVVNELTPSGIFLKVRNLLQYGVENPAVFDWSDSQVEEAKKMLKHFFFFSDLATKYIADRENILITMSDQKVVDINTSDMDVDPDTYESVEDSIEDMYSKEESLPEGWTIKHQHLSAKNSLSNEVRSVLSNVYKIGYNGEIERNSLNFPKKINPDLVHSVLMDKLRYMTESKDLIPMLQELSKQRKWVEPILTLLETDKSLESKFYQDFRKDFVTYRVIKRFIKPDGSFYFKTVDINKPRGIEYLTQEWRDNYESGTQLSNLSIYNTNGTVNRKNLDLLKDKTTKLLSDFLKNSDKYDFNKSSKWTDENIEEVGDILRAIGISETNDVINLALNTNPYGEKSLLKYHHPISKILQDVIALSHTTNIKRIGFLNGSEVPLDWQKEFKNTYVNLATIFSSVTEDAIESSVHENGKSYYSHQVPSYLNKYVKKFKYSNEEDFKNFIEQEFGRYHQFYDFKNQSFRDGWIKDLVENSEDRKLLDIHTMLNYNKVDYSSLSELDYTVAMIQEYFSTGNSNSAYYHVPILSDSPAGIFIKFKKYDYGKDSIIPTKNGENQTYEQHLTDKFIEVVKLEYLRIKLVKERNKILSNDSIIKEIKNFDKRGEKFILFPKLNDHYEEIDRLIRTDSDAAPQMLHKLLSTVINETMAEEFLKAVENWEKIGLFNESKQGTVDAFGTNKETSLSQLHNYFWNSAYATSQIIQMTSGDLSMFGSVEDFQKRNKQIYSPTSKLNSSSKYGKEILKTVLLKDNIVTSGSLLNYQEVFRSIGMPNSQIGQVLLSYFAGDGGGINQTDGQAYGSLNSFRAIEDMGGRWTEERLKAFDKLIDWSNGKKGVKFTAEDFTKLTGVQPMKPFVYTQKAVKSGIKDDLGNEILIKTPFLNKNSLYMLTITGLMARSPKVVGMNNFMQDNNIDILQFDSAVKVGAQGTIDINTINSAKDIKTYLESSTGLSKNAVNEELQSQTVHNIPIEDFGIQLPIDDKLMDKSSLFGSQIRKIITSDMPDDPNFKINVNNKNYTKKEWFDLYNSLIVENIIDDFVRLKDQFGSNEEIEKILLQEIRGNKRYDRDMEAAVTLNKNGEFPIPLYDPIISNQIQQLLTSVIKNRITKQKIKGGSVVQVSNYGFDENLSVRFKDKDGNIIPTQKEWLSLNKGSDANDYKSYIKDNQNGIAYYEAYMPAYSQLFFDELMDEDTGMINPSKLPEDLRKVIGYRIPTEDKYSMVPIYIKGFLPQQAGSAVMLPADITAIMGSDFDIDKLYIMVPEFTVQRYNIKKIKNKYNELFGASDKILNSIFEDIDDIVGEDQFKEFFNNNKESFLLRTPKFQKVRYNDNKLPQDNSLKARNNMLIDMMWGVLTNKDTAHKMLNPQSFNILKKIASIISILENNNYEDLKNIFGKNFYNTLNKLSLEDLSKISDHYKREFNILNPTTQTFLHKLNMTAAQLIGIAANHNANHSMMLWTKIGLSDHIAFTLNGYKLSSLHNILNYTGEYISRNTATYLAASVDAVKDPVLDKLNINTFTADSVFLLSRLGHTPLTIGLFLKQPVIVELTDYYINNKLSGLSKSQIINLFIKNYAQKNGQVLSKITDTDIRNEELAFNIADKSKSNDFYKGQMKVLNKFIQVFDAATVIGNLTAATRADTGGGASGPTFAATETKMNKLKDFLVSNVYSEKPTIVNGEILSTLIDIDSDPNEKPTKNAQSNTMVKEGVSKLFKSNPELANVGTPEQYSQYLDTIFPDSKVKDILYHGSKSDFDIFKNRQVDEEVGVMNGIYLAPNIKYAKEYGKNIKHVIINTINPLITEGSWTGIINDETKQKVLDRGYDAVINNAFDNSKFDKFLDKLKLSRTRKETIVFEPEQIHILGSKTDIEGFRKFIQGEQPVTPKQGVAELFESNPELANQVYEALGFGKESNLPTGDETINIYTGSNQNAELSNFAIRPFTTNVETSSGEKQYTFQSVEQGFHFYKALVANNPQVAKQILATTNGGQLKRLTNRSNLKMTPEQVKEWDDTSKSIMLNLMYDSYAQNPKAAEKLLATGNAKITHTQDNTRWKTDFPEVVMTVRDMLKEEGFSIQSQPTPQQKQQAQQLYSQYLDTIFPNSKVKNIVYHGTNNKEKILQEGFKNNSELFEPDDDRAYESGELGYGYYFTTTQQSAKNYGEPLAVILNNPDITNETTFNLSTNEKGIQHFVKTKEQIHILGSKQDIKGFKEFVNSQNVSQPIPVSNNNNYKSKLRNQIKSSELPMLQAFYTLGLQSTETLLGDKFPHFRNDFRFVVDSLRSFTYRGSLSDKTTNKVYDDLLAYIMSGTEFLSAPNLEKYGEEYRYFMEELPKEFAKIQGDLKYKNNTFVQSLKVQPANKLYPFTTIVLRNSGKLSRDLKQHLRDQWADLLYGDKDSKELAMKLFKYNYMRNGFSFNPDSFIHLAPTLLKVNVPQYISQLERISQEPDTSENVTKYSEFIEMFIRNNTNIRELVPLIDKETGINFVQNNQILDSFKVYIPSQNNEEFVQVPPGIQQFKISDNNTSVNFKPFVLVKVGDDEILYKLVSQTDRKGTYEKTKPLGYSGHHKQYFFGVSADTLSDSVEVIKPQFKEFDPSDFTNSSVVPDMDTDLIAMQGYIREYYDLVETSTPEELSQARIEYTFTQNGLMDKVDTPSAKNNNPLDFDAEAMSKYFNLDDEINTIMNELNAYGKDGNYRRFLKYGDIEKVINNFNKNHRLRDKFVASYVKGYHSKDNFVFYRLQIKPRTKLNSIEATQLEYNEKLNKKIREILLKHNIKTGALTTLEAKQALGGVMDTSQAKEAIDGVVELIRLANGERGEQALPEEFAHFVIEAMGNDPLASRLLNLINLNNFVEEILGDSFENYKKQYDNNPLMLAKEAAGKLLAKHFLQNQEIQDNPWKSLLKRVINKIKQFFTNILGTDLNKAKYQLESEYNKVAKGIMEGTYNSIINIKNIVNTPDNIKLYNLEERISRDRTLLKKMVETETKLFYIAESKKTQKQDLIEQKELIEKINRRLERNDKLEELAGIQEFLSHIVSKLTELNTDIQKLYQTKDSIKDINNIAGKLREANDFYHAYMKILKDIKSGMAQDILDNTSRFGEKVKAQVSEAMDHANVIKEAYDTLSIELFSSFLEPFLGEGVRDAYFKKTGENLNISKILTESDHDIGMASRWLESMSRINDLPSQLIDAVVKKQRSEARLKTINIAKQLQAAHLKLEKAGIKNTDWMYERDADGKLTGKYVTEVSTNDYYTALHNYKNQLEKDYPGIDNFYTRSVKMNDWFIENREGDTLRPKKSIYASKQYMMLNKAQREYHKEFMNIKEELDKLLPPDVVSLEKTVMMRKDFLERVVKSSSIKEGVEQVVDNLKDLFVRRIDDTDFGDAGIVNTVTDFGGNEVTSLPVYYVKRLENMDALSLDATSTLIAYAHMANDYNSMNNVIHALELGRDVLRKRGVSYTQAGNPKVEEIQHMGRKIVNKLFKRGNESNIMQRLNDYFSMQVYGRYIKDQGNVPFTNVKISKLADRINQWTSLSSTALSFFVGSTNVLTGAAQTNIDAVAGEHFNVKDLANADKNYAKDLKEMIGELGKRVKTSKLSLVTELFNTTQELESKLKYSNMDRKNWLSKMFSMETLYFMSTGGEHWLHTRVALAMMEKIRLKDKNGKEFSLYDSLEVVPIDSKNKSYGAELKVKEGYTKLDGTAFTKNDINTLVNKSAHINQLLHGVYNRADRDAAQALAQGRLLEMFRKWMYTAITRRYGKGQYNVELDAYSEGYYRTFGNFVLQLVRDLKRGLFMLQSRSKALEPWLKANMLRVITDLGQILTVASLLALVDWDDDDRKNKPWGINAIEYLLRRLLTELLSTAPLPWGVTQEGRRILESPMAGMTLIQNIIDLTTFWEWSDEVTRGRYKGLSKFVKSVAELVPLNKTIYGIFHPEEKILFYKRDM